MSRFICTMNQPKFIDLNRVEVNSIQRVSIIQNKLIDFYHKYVFVPCTLFT